MLSNALRTCLAGLAPLCRLVTCYACEFWLGRKIHTHMCKYSQCITILTSQECVPCTANVFIWITHLFSGACPTVLLSNAVRVIPHVCHSVHVNTALPILPLYVVLLSTLVRPLSFQLLQGESIFTYSRTYYSYNLSLFLIHCISMEHSMNRFIVSMIRKKLSFVIWICSKWSFA